MTMTHVRAGATLGISTDAATVSERLLASVVLISSGRGAGSGVIWQPDGLIVTNSHVVHSPNVEVTLRDGTELAGTLVARDPSRDLAAIKVAATDLPAATIGDSAHLHVGQFVLAAGNPLGLRGVVTAGIITAVGQVVAGAGTRLDDLIQADVSLAPGNSGGPLADVEGRVLGINAMISAAGIALAIPAAAVRAFLAPHRPNRPYLGISGLPVTVQAAGTRRGGLLLTAVDEGSPADRAGMLQGDIVVGLDGGDVQGEDDVHYWMGTWQSGRPVQIDVVRGQEPRRFLLAPSIQAA
jgi:S1-C subfamily serine protease